MSKLKCCLMMFGAVIIGAASGAEFVLGKRRLRQERKKNIIDRIITTPWGKDGNIEWREKWNRLDKEKTKNFIRQRLSALEEEWGQSVRNEHIDEEGLAYYCTQYAAKDVEETNMMWTINELCTHNNRENRT